MIASSDCCNLSVHKPIGCRYGSESVKMAVVEVNVDDSGGDGSMDQEGENCEVVVEGGKKEPENILQGFICRHEHFCTLCETEITKGSRIYPIRPKSETNSREWVHFSCARAEGIINDLSKRPVCKHWARLGKCLFKETCFFAHPAEAAGSVQGRRTWGGRRVAVRNDGRANEFRRFIVRTFGIEILSRGSGVLDVAGGKGELTFLLENLNGIRCTCVEPRTLRLHKFARRFKFGMFHRTRIVSGRYVTRNYTEGLRVCKQIRMCLHGNLISAMVENDHNVMTRLISESLESSKELRWSSKGLHEHEYEHGVEGENADENEVCTSEDEGVDDGTIHCEEITEKTSKVRRDEDENRETVSEVEDVVEIIDILRNASAIVGMHADQATGAIVDLALALKVPFAVVPCCVYLKTFPERKLKDGTDVTNYDLLIRYLVEKDPENIGVTTLDFEGKNKVVYSLPVQPKE